MVMGYLKNCLLSHIINYQDDNEIPSKISENGTYQVICKEFVLAELGKKNSHPLMVGILSGQPCGKQYGGFSRKSEFCCYGDPAKIFWVYIPGYKNIYSK